MAQRSPQPTQDRQPRRSGQQHPLRVPAQIVIAEAGFIEHSTALNDAEHVHNLQSRIIQLPQSANHELIQSRDRIVVAAPTISALLRRLITRPVMTLAGIRRSCYKDELDQAVAASLPPATQREKQVPRRASRRSGRPVAGVGTEGAAVIFRSKSQSLRWP
jgi:hypothetical protein